ncbi:MAG TPA: GNAT family N-acetyltransferase [Anaerolineales bacterium]|nr:GNAT family N-acetyltransferase [Anaerolineales bacterium]HNA88898.1 GNAT family N-acetyltransferase [Anaerolineales bacterium]HNB36191.1 GNAT family N-acetyltransferase [Anaerolineales bacterium]HNC07483.1 GNAT family N-acetyltransferase [Anaerolineales bacterium]
MNNKIIFRRAVQADLSAIVHMLADDELGSQRERDELPLFKNYIEAFEKIDADKNHELIVAEMHGEVIGTLHLIFLPSISYMGGTRSQVESVRVDSKYRSQGIGAQMMAYAIERAKEHGAHVMQLTSHMTRKDAHRFYEKLGFQKAHVGMKLNLK